MFILKGALRQSPTIFLLFILASSAFGQNYSTNSAGSWTGGVWTNTSGYGGPAPGTTGGNGTLTISHAIEVAGNLNLGNYNLIIEPGGSLKVNGNLSGGWGSVNLQGNLEVTGNLTKSGDISMTSGDLAVDGFINGPSNISISNGDVSVGGAVTVTSLVTPNGGVTVGTTVNATTLTAGGDLSVPGNLTVTTLTVSNSDVTLGGAMAVTTLNFTNVDATVTNGAAISGNINMTGSTLAIGGNLSGGWGTTTATSSSLSITGNLTKTGNMTVGGDLSVGGHIEGPSNIAVSNGDVETGTYINNLSSLSIIDGNLDAGTYISDISTLTVSNGNIDVPGNFSDIDNLNLSNGSGTFGGTTEFGNPQLTSYDITVTNDLQLSGTMSVSGGSLDIGGNFSGGGTISVEDADFLVDGNFTRGGGANVTIGRGSYLKVIGDINLNAQLQVNRGALTYVDGSVTVNSAEYLVIAQNNQTTDASEYADMVITGNLTNDGSGDVSVNYNGRLAVYGNLVDSSDGGTFLRLREGSQVYIHGNIDFTGGGGAIQNEDNANDPFGLYVNGDINNTNGVTDPDDITTITVNGVDVTVPCYEADEADCTLPSGTTSNVGDQQTMIDNNPDFTDWVESLPGSPLAPMPITLIDFRVFQNTDNFIELKWITAAEIDNSHFVILRSTDGMHWEQIGQMPGNGTTTIEHTYTFKDNSPLAGLNYYLIKQIDFNGDFETFGPISGRFSQSAADAVVYPNPVADILKVQLSTGGFEVQLFDMKGELVLKQTSRSNVLNWDVSTLQSGVFVLKIYSNNSLIDVVSVVKN